MEYPQNNTTGIILKDSHKPVGICLGNIQMPSDDACLSEMYNALVDSKINPEVISTVETDVSISAVLMEGSSKITNIAVCPGEGADTAEATSNSLISKSPSNSFAVWLDKGFYFQSSGDYQDYLFTMKNLLVSGQMSVIVSPGSELETGFFYIIENEHIEWLRKQIFQTGVE